MSLKDIFLCILVTAIWGGNFSVIQIGLNELDPFMLTALRFLLCCIPLIFFIKKPNVNYFVIVLYGIIFGIGFWGMTNLGMYIGLSPGLSSLLLQFSAFFTIAWGVLIFKEKVNTFQVIGFLISICGLVLILLTRNEKGSFYGGLLVIFAALSWSVCNVIVKKNSINNMLSFIIHSSLYSAIFLFILTYFVKGDAAFLSIKNNLNAAAIFSIVFQSYITTLFGYWVWNRLVKKYSLTKIAPFSLFVPVFGMLTSILLLGESVDDYKIYGAAIILLGLFTFIFSHVFSRAFSQ